MRQLDNWLHEYMEYSAYSEAPDKFHFWTGVSVIAGALRRHVWMDMGYFQWTPNFYIVFVAPPGIVSKSTTANIGMGLLRRLNDIAFGPDAVTWQSLVQSLANSTESFELNGEYYPMSAITIVSSEFGTFLNPNDREMVDVLVSLWDGQLGVWKKATKTQGDDAIENPWINIVACTTPAWIAGNFPEYMIGGGFTSRTVFVYGERKRHLSAYPGDHLPPDHQARQDKLVHDLEVIATEMKGQFVLSPDAKIWGEQWYANHFNTPHPPHLNNERFGGYLARKQTHIHKLAMVLSASESNDLIIEQKHLEEADQIMTGLEFDMPRVFSNIGKSDATRAISDLVQYIKANGKMSATELYNKFHDRLTYSEFEEAVISAIHADLLTKTGTGSSVIVSPTARLLKESKEDEETDDKAVNE